MSKKDYYDLLGVAKNATDKEIKSAFRQKAKKLHPDQNQGNPNAEKAFKEINEAYEVLKDSEKRAAYDQYGHAAFEGGMGGEDMLAQGLVLVILVIFLKISLLILWVDLVLVALLALHVVLICVMICKFLLRKLLKGKQLLLKFQQLKNVILVMARVVQIKSQPQTCGTCHGRGSVRAQSGFFTVERTCPTCGGVGKIIKNPCRSCQGTGQKNTHKMIDVTIPAGVDSGNRIMVSGEGAAGERSGQKVIYIFLLKCVNMHYLSVKKQIYIVVYPSQWWMQF